MPSVHPYYVWINSLYIDDVVNAVLEKPTEQYDVAELTYYCLRMHNSERVLYMNMNYKNLLFFFFSFDFRTPYIEVKVCLDGK